MPSDEQRARTVSGRRELALTVIALLLGADFVAAAYSGFLNAVEPRFLPLGLVVFELPFVLAFGRAGGAYAGSAIAFVLGALFLGIGRCYRNCCL
jgi:hypothetical protein